MHLHFFSVNISWIGACVAQSYACTHTSEDQNNKPDRLPSFLFFPSNSFI